MDNGVDCRGLLCPQPVIKTKKVFHSLKVKVNSDSEVIVIVDNEVAKNNIIKFAQGNDYKYKLLENQGVYQITITKEMENFKTSIKIDEKFILVIASNRLGDGNEALGLMLMKSYLYALSESIEILKSISYKGVNILSCGTCLDFYNLKEKLCVGEISNMYTIVEKMNQYNKVIKI
jgi:TusA-related sulfurtransferase/peroxiredoxin family protein